VAAFLRWRAAMDAHRLAVRTAADQGGRRYTAWRRRIMQRAQGELPPALVQEIVFGAAALELSRGCSVGCGFCAVGAEKLTAVASHDPATAALWRGMLAELDRAIGPAARTAFGYWATDPYDVPEFPAFMTDFADRFGIAPSVTTALGADDPALTRAMIALFKARGGGPLRVSVLTTKQLRRLYDLVPPGDRVYVATVLHTPGAQTYRVRAGRALTRARGAARLGGEGTIACVAGFLVNLPDRRLSLISPCNADSRRPNGYRIHDELRFRDAAEFGAHLATLIADHMPETLGGGDWVALRPGLTVGEEGGLALADRHARYRLRDGPTMRALLNGLRAGGPLAALEAGLLADGHSPFEIKFLAQAVFEAGLLADAVDRADLGAARQALAG
jgi:hypothetical protein